MQQRAKLSAKGVGKLALHYNAAFHRGGNPVPDNAVGHTQVPAPIAFDL